MIRRMDVQPSNPRRVTAALSAFVLGSAVYAQQAAPKVPTEPELVGTLPYSTTNGPTQYIVVQVGDGGSGPYKAVLVGHPNLKTHTLYRPRALNRFPGNPSLPLVGSGKGASRNAPYEVRN